MANGELCARCKYQESEHYDPSILGDRNLSVDEFWKKHKKLRDCLLSEDGSVYKFISDQKVDPESEGIILEVKNDAESISVRFIPGD